MAISEKSSRGGMGPGELLQQCGLGQRAQGWDVCNEHAGTRWSWHRCQRVGGKKSPCLARVGAEKWHNHVPETVPQAEKGLWHITRAVQEAQGMMDLQV